MQDLKVRMNRNVQNEVRALQSQHDIIVDVTDYRKTVLNEVNRQPELCQFDRLLLTSGSDNLNQNTVSVISDPRVAYCALFPVFFDEVCTVDQLSSALGVSKFRLHHIFTQNTGISLKLYMRIVKIQMAAMKLLMTAEKMIDISFGTGYDSQEAFIRAFKKHFQLTPGTYKKTLRKELTYHKTQPSKIAHKIQLSAKVVQNELFDRNEVGKFIRAETLRHGAEAGYTVLSQAPLGSLQLMLCE